jgi:hypothetical protein
MTGDGVSERLDRYNMMARLQIAVAVGVFFVLVYSLAFVRCGFWVVFGVGMLTAGGSLLAGFLLGFIFGIPRTSKDASNPPPSSNQQQGKVSEQTTQKNAPAGHISVDPNSNLVEISDWLTKILVGVGLVELSKIPGKMTALTGFVAGGLRGREGAAYPNASQAVALGIIVFFFCAGFLIAYLWARLYLQRAFRYLEDLADDVNKGWYLSLRAEKELDNNNLSDALNFIDMALESSPSNARAHLLRGMILKRMAPAQEQDAKTRKSLLTQALAEAKLSRKLWQNDPSAPYNIACYEALLNKRTSIILSSLREAFALDSKLKARAPRDSDLVAVWSSDEFKKLTDHL